MRRFILILAVLKSAFAAAREEPPVLKPPPDSECPALPPAKWPLSFKPGEELEYQLDALGALAGKLTLKVLPIKESRLPIHAFAQTNTFFSKIRQVKGQATSYLNPRTLRPVQYVEDAHENAVHKYADVEFRTRDHSVRVNYQTNGQPAYVQFHYAGEGLDPAGLIYLLRQLPLKPDGRVCVDVYGIRRLWRVWGKIQAKEHLSLPLGEFEAWHLSGWAVRLDNHRLHRELHVWISDDARRLPLVAVGAIDLGTIRATLRSYSRPGEKSKVAQGKETLKW